MARSRQVVGLLTLLALIADRAGRHGRAGLAAGWRRRPARAAGRQSSRGIDAAARAAGRRARVPGRRAERQPGRHRCQARLGDALRSHRATAQRVGAAAWRPRGSSSPRGVAVAGDSYYVVDRGMPRIFRLDNTGQPQAVIDLQPLGAYGLNGVAVDAGGNVYVADTGRNRILVFSPAGQLVKQVGHGGTDLGGFTQPMMLAFAPDGSLFVCRLGEHARRAVQRRHGGDRRVAAGLSLVRHRRRRHGPRLYARFRSSACRRVLTAGRVAWAKSAGQRRRFWRRRPGRWQLRGSAEPSLYVLGSDQIQRLDLREHAAAAARAAAGRTCSACW